MLTAVSDSDFSKFLHELLIIMLAIICEKIFWCPTDSMSDRFFFHNFILIMNYFNAHIKKDTI